MLWAFFESASLWALAFPVISDTGVEVVSEFECGRGMGSGEGSPFPSGGAARSLPSATIRGLEAAQGTDLILFLALQDVAHRRGRTCPPAAVNVPRTPSALAGFQVTTTGRFWVTAEGTRMPQSCSVLSSGYCG